MPSDESDPLRLPNCSVVESKELERGIHGFGSFTIVSAVSLPSFHVGEPELKIMARAIAPPVLATSFAANFEETGVVNSVDLQYSTASS
ncbi:hypothetical protein Tdes44962_MAKER04574 [Teratosphaeria destructans]|uniref:Uncharacterized protein n=1 Tax=Teratosphaeria destructans TaxID=418781 RepID=A0A9W7SM30_9PEZI|nr:hypothetical protein Tdes44962_MAKER04574 [Teratosphaeria destructans]